MNVTEVLKQLIKEDFSYEKVPLFKKVMCQSLGSFCEGTILVDKFDRFSDEYKKITRYHVEATKDRSYLEMFKRVLDIACNEPEKIVKAMKDEKSRERN